MLLPWLRVAGLAVELEVVLGAVRVVVRWVALWELVVDSD